MMADAALRTAVAVGLGVCAANLLLAASAHRAAGVGGRPGVTQVVSALVCGLTSAAMQLHGTHFGFFAVWPTPALRPVGWRRRLLAALLGGLPVLGLAAVAIPVSEHLCSARPCADLAPGLIQGLLGGAGMSATLLPYLLTGFLRPGLPDRPRVSPGALRVHVALVLLGIYAEFEYAMVDLLGSWIDGLWGRV